MGKWLFQIHPCYKADFLQKFEASKVTFGILFWLLSDHFVQIWEKNKVHFYLLAFLKDTCFVYNVMGNGAVEGAITSYFEELKGLLL